MKSTEEAHSPQEKRTRLAGFPLAPLNDRVVVRVLEEAERVTKGGIALPKSTEIPQRGLVVAVGPGALSDTLWHGEMVLAPTRLPMSVKPGDVVYFARYAGVELRVDEEDYLALRERDVIAVDCRSGNEGAEGHA